MHHQRYLQQKLLLIEFVNFLQCTHVQCSASFLKSSGTIDILVVELAPRLPPPQLGLGKKFPFWYFGFKFYFFGSLEVHVMNNVYFFEHFYFSKTLYYIVSLSAHHICGTFCNMCSFSFKFNMSQIQLKNVYLTKFREAYKSKEEKNKEELEGVYEINFRKFQVNDLTRFDRVYY